jgi:hypothetical protein
MKPEIPKDSSILAGEQRVSYTPLPGDILTTHSLDTSALLYKSVS